MVQTPRRQRTPLLSLLLGLSMVSVGSSFQADLGGTATKPEARADEWWQNLHQSFLERAKRPMDVLFLGDSITQGWGENAVWKEFYAKRNPANFGIGGDRTQHVLWRLSHDEIKGVSPKIVVLMIGTNNVGVNTSAEIAEGVREIVATLRKRLPTTKVLLLGVFPRGENLSREYRDANETAKLATQPAEINALIAKLDDGKMVRYLDVSLKFVSGDGTLPKELMPDFIHLSVQGYRIWAEAMEPLVAELIGESRS